MTTDRELLEGAARAAGYAIAKFEESYVWIIEKPDALRSWNPITNYGDTLRLEVELKFNTSWDWQSECWYVGGVVKDEFKWLAFDKDRKRATTKAAYEIGKSMKDA